MRKKSRRKLGKKSEMNEVKMKTRRKIRTRRRREKERRREKRWKRMWNRRRKRRRGSEMGYDKKLFNSGFFFNYKVVLNVQNGRSKWAWPQ